MGRQQAYTLLKSTSTKRAQLLRQYFEVRSGVHAGETERNLIPTHAEAGQIEEYLAEPLEVGLGKEI